MGDMTRIRIRNANVDFTVEGETLEECMRIFTEEFPQERNNAVSIEWLEGDMQQLEAVKWKDPDAT